MRILRLLVLFVLFSAGSAFAAPVLTLGPVDVTVTVPPGHRVAWISAAKYPLAVRSGLVTDTDGDGVVVLGESPRDVVYWIAADVETGEWTTAVERDYGLFESQIGRDADGAPTMFFVFSMLDSGGGLWIRPGVGAWRPPNVVFAGSEHAGGENVLVMKTTAMAPLPSSPATPDEFEHGDVLLMLSEKAAMTGLVDARLDDPPSPGIVHFDHSTISPSEGGVASVKVLRTWGTAGTVSVRCSVANATAEEGVDYVPFAPVELTFGPGETVKSAMLTLLDDGVYSELPRDVTLTLDDFTGGARAYPPEQQTVSIVDDDPVPVLAFGDAPATVAEGDTPWTLSVPWSLEGAFRGPIQLRVFAPGTDNLVVLQPGDTQRTISVPIAADDVPSASRLLSISLINESGRIARLDRTITVVDDDQPELQVPDIVAIESWSKAILPFSVSPPPYEPAHVTWTTVDGTAKAGTDYVAASGTTSVSASNEISIALIDDQIPEEQKTFYVDITSVSGSVLPPERTRIAVTVADDDVRVQGLSIVVPDPILERDAGDQTVPLRLQLAAPVSYAVLVELRSAPDSTAAPNDYFYPQGVLTFLPGETFKEVPLRIVGDERDEDDEKIVLEAVQNGAVVAIGTVTILDDDDFAFISIHDTIADEKPGSPVYAVFRVAFSKPAPASGSFRYATVAETATSGSDYVASTGRIAFAAGDTELEIIVRVIDDPLPEPHETFRVELSDLTGPGSYLHADHAVATIRDDDGGTPAPIVLLSASSQLEGNEGEQEIPIRVRLATALSSPVTITVATTTGTATPDSDYRSMSRLVPFAAGMTEVDVPLVIFGDVQDENDETIEITATHEGLVLATLTFEILDDDETRPTKRRTVRP